MKAFYCNINKINENVDDFVIAKNKIEEPLIKQNKISKKMSIKEFLDYIDLTKNIFMFNNSTNDVIPFDIYYRDPLEVIIVISSNCSEKQENIFKDKLESINFNLDRLKEITQLDMLQQQIKSEYFLINNKFYI